MAINNKKRSYGNMILLIMLAILVMAVAITSFLSPRSTEGGLIKAGNTEKLKGVWISYMEFGKMIKDKDVAEYQATVTDCLENIKSLGLNTVILHVRSHCDAFYESEYFPWSYQVAGEQGKGVAFDPLKEFIALAHPMGIAVHAWINPYRVTSGSSGLDSVAVNNPAIGLSAEEQAVVSLETGVYLNPASESVRTLIINGVRELIENYEIDGIHFDDYFYPTTDESFDNLYYKKYLDAADSSIKLSLDAWRRMQTNLMVSGVYTAVKSSGRNVCFGISPQASISRNYDSLYADVQEWAGGGYCDYICPQIYFGFEYPLEGYDFSSLAEAWKEITSNEVELVFGLAPYKSGTTDQGSDEWIRNTDILKRQCEYAKKLAAGVCFYSYGSLFSDKETCAAERQNLSGAL